MSKAHSKVKRLPFGLLAVYGTDRWGYPCIEFVREDKEYSQPDIPIASGRSLTLTWGGYPVTSFNYEVPTRWNFGIGRLWVEMI